MKKHSLGIILASWLAVVIVAGLIFLMSSSTDTNLSQEMGIFSSIYNQLQLWQIDVLGEDFDILSVFGHFLEYVVLGAALMNALRLHTTLKKACYLAIVLASIYGISDEFHQFFVPGRTSDPIDWVVDTVGAFVGAALVYLGFRAKEKKNETSQITQSLSRY